MDSTRLEELGLVKVCRACLSDEAEVKSVFHDVDEDCDPIWKKMEYITSLEVNQYDGLPEMICLSCELRLNSAYNFRIQCQKSCAALKKYIETTVLSDLKEEAAYEENLIEESYKVETVIEEANIQVDSDSGNDNNDNGEDDDGDDDEDDKPLSCRKEEKRKEQAQYTAEVVNEAIIASKKNYNERRECRICGFISSNARGLSLHIGHLHKELKDKWCGVCYKEVDDLPEHLKLHSKVKSYSCTFCGKGFTSRGHLTEHIRTHSTERPYKCKECGKGFLSARHLRVHDRIHSGEKPYICPHCGRRFTQNGSLQGHIRTHTGLKPYVCDVCDKKCTTSSSLSAHRLKTGHVPTKPQSPPLINTTNLIETTPNNSLINDDNKPIVIETEQSFGDEITEKNKKLCTVCGKTFSTASKLRLHMRVHTGETPYKCSYCEKRFSTRGQLVVHVRTHTGERPHVCHVCGKGFAQSSVLNTHMKLHTGRPEVCHVCQQRFCRPAELRLHMRKHTGEKPYLCTECGQAFIQRSHLMEHIKIHSDERPYKCTLCERAFKQSSSLKSHVQIHTGHKPYQCSQCPYACRQSYALTQHMKQHQGDLPQADKPHECVVCHRSFTTIAMLNSHTRSVHNAIF